MFYYEYLTMLLRRLLVNNLFNGCIRKRNFQNK